MTLKLRTEVESFIYFIDLKIELTFMWDNIMAWGGGALASVHLSPIFCSLHHAPKQLYSLADAGVLVFILLSKEIQFIPTHIDVFSSEMVLPGVTEAHPLLVQAVLKL